MMHDYKVELGFRIDTHRHLGGCIPPRWVWEQIKANNWTYMGRSLDEVTDSMTFTAEEEPDFQRFLSKFTILDNIEWNADLIDSSIKAVCEDFEADQLDYVWLDFSINKYLSYLDWHKKDLVKFIYDSFQRYYPDKVGLILSLKYESLKASQCQYADLIEDDDVADMLFGIDLVGDESFFDTKFYKPLLEPWRDRDKMVRAHVSESQPARNAFEAITQLPVTNIAHGIRLMDKQEYVDKVIDYDITYDLGLTSNYVAGVVSAYHPINKMVQSGMKITLGTDDPVQCDTLLDKEFKLAYNLGINYGQLKRFSRQAFDNTVKFK
ncbi:MAG: hypothetical protein ACXADH_00165 [Candidatus Kariarchaeaceae archaeon]|jgi:adenosine deaminase